MKKIDLKNKTVEELKKLLSEKRVLLKGFRFGVSGSKTKNIKEGSNLKKDIARIMTSLNAFK